VVPRISAARLAGSGDTLPRNRAGNELDGGGAGAEFEVRGDVEAEAFAGGDAEVEACAGCATGALPAPDRVQADSSASRTRATMAPTGCRGNPLTLLLFAGR
jgi:hypothetical protein